MAKTPQRRPSKATAGPVRNLKNTPATGATATKSERVTLLLQRPKGASIAEIMTTTGWQQHSVRGFMSGTIVKRKGFAVVSDKTGGERRYRIVEAAS